MAQNYPDVEGLKADNFNQEQSDSRRSGADDTGDGFQDCQTDLSEPVREPENVLTGERNTDYPMEEQKAYSGTENPSDGAVGTIGEEKLASDPFPKVIGEDRYTEWGREDSGIKAPEQDVGVGDNLQQQSPYTQHDSKLDYNERGYGGQGYEEPGQVQEEPFVAHEQKSEPVHEGTKEKAQAPSHMTHNIGEQAPKSPGFVEKIKEKLTGKPHHEAATNITDGEAGYGDQQPTSDAPKKGVLEKIKEKISQSP